MTRTSENAYIKVNGTITAAGLPKLLGALWRLDLGDAQSVAKLKTRFGSVMDESAGTVRFASGSLLIVQRASFKRMSDKKVRTTHYRITGSLEEDDLDAITDRGIESHWESNEDDELCVCLTTEIQEYADSRNSIHLDSVLPAKS